MNLRKMIISDEHEVMSMMKLFYDSPAVLVNADEKILKNDFLYCIGDSPYLDGFIIELDNNIAGYSMITKSFSTEYGCMCCWIEDVYIKPEYRGMGLGRFLFNELERLYNKKMVRFRLEVEKNNFKALALYKKMGFNISAYIVMDKIVNLENEKK